MLIRQRTVLYFYPNQIEKPVGNRKNPTIKLFNQDKDCLIPLILYIFNLSLLPVPEKQSIEEVSN